jgi:hypothetical protein
MQEILWTWPTPGQQKFERKCARCIRWMRRDAIVSCGWSGGERTAAGIDAIAGTITGLAVFGHHHLAEDSIAATGIVKRGLRAFLRAWLSLAYGRSKRLLPPPVGASIKQGIRFSTEGDLP